MERGRKNPAGDFARAAESGPAACGLSGVARGSEWQGGPSGARGDKRRDDPGADSRNGAHHGKVCTHPGSEFGDCHFPSGSADTACAVERRRTAAAFCKSVGYTPTNLYECQRKGLTKFAFCKRLVTKALRPGESVPTTPSAPSPLVFVSVASKGLRVYVSDLESTLAGIPISVDSKGAYIATKTVQNGLP